MLIHSRLNNVCVWLRSRSFEHKKISLPQLSATVAKHDFKAGHINGNMLASAGLGAASFAPYQKKACNCVRCTGGVSVRRQWVDLDLIAVLEINFAPRSSLEKLGLPPQRRPAHSASSMPMTSASTTLIDVACDDEDVKPSGLKRVKLARSKAASEVIDLTDD